MGGPGDIHDEMGGSAILSEKELKNWAWDWANRMHEATKLNPNTPETAKLLDDWQIEIKRMAEGEAGPDQADYGAMLSLMTTGYYDYLFRGGEGEYLKWVQKQMEQHRRVLQS